MDNDNKKTNSERADNLEQKKLTKYHVYPLTIAICSGVVLYVILTHLGTIHKALAGVGGYFGAVLIGCVLAYMMNPLAMLYQKMLFKDVKKGGWGLSAIMAVLTVLLVIVFLAHNIDFGLIV